MPRARPCPELPRACRLDESRRRAVARHRRRRIAGGDGEAGGRAAGRAPRRGRPSPLAAAGAGRAARPATGHGHRLRDVPAPRAAGAGPLGRRAISPRGSSSSSRSGARSGICRPSSTCPCSSSPASTASPWWRSTSTPQLNKAITAKGWDARPGRRAGRRGPRPRRRPRPTATRCSRSTASTPPSAERTPRRRRRPIAPSAISSRRRPCGTGPWRRGWRGTSLPRRRPRSRWRWGSWAAGTSVSATACRTSCVRWA